MRPIGWPQVIAVSGFWLALVVVVVAAVRRGRRALQPLETSRATIDADGLRSPPDHATSDIDEIVRRLARDPEFPARTADLIDRARSARHLEDIGPVVGPDKSAATHQPIPEEWTIKESTPEGTASWCANGDELEASERGRPVAKDVVAMRKERREDLGRKAGRTSPRDDAPFCELIPEDVLSDMERLTKIICRSVHELDPGVAPVKQRARSGSRCHWPWSQDSDLNTRLCSGTEEQARDERLRWRRQSDQATTGKLLPPGNPDGRDRGEAAFLG